MGWQARAAQSGQRAANLSEATIQALWDEACNDSPQNPGWSRHIRFARAIEQAGQRAGVDAVEIMRICRLFLDEKEGDYDDTRPNHPGKASAATPAAQGGEQP
ncbi:hypothetical protein [Ralstonia phage RPZH6]|nr:hypothetical protein [Ralstonia phage RPZH6]